MDLMGSTCQTALRGEVKARMGTSVTCGHSGECVLSLGELSPYWGSLQPALHGDSPFLQGYK